MFGSIADDIRAELAAAEDEQIKLMQAEKKSFWWREKKSIFWKITNEGLPRGFHFWGGKLGYECWKDTNFLNWIEKRWGDLVKIKSQSQQK